MRKRHIGQNSRKYYKKRDQSQHPRARNDHDEEAAYGGYMSPESGFQSGPGDSVDAD